MDLLLRYLNCYASNSLVMPQKLKDFKLVANSQPISLYEGAEISIPEGLSDYLRHSPVTLPAPWQDEVDGVQTQLQLKEVVGFTVYGTTDNIELPTSGLRLWANGKPLECVTIFNTVKDNIAEDGHQIEFELELPGYIWEVADNNEVQLQFSTGSTETPWESGITISTGQAKDWLVDIALGLYGEDIYRQLLALEHLHFLDVGSLPQSTTLVYHQLAEKFSLTEYAKTVQLSQVNVAPNQLSSSVREIAYRQALNFVNNNLPMHEGKEHRLIEKVCRQFALDTSQTQQLIYVWLPFFCRVQRLDLLLPLIDQTELQTLKDCRSLWMLSISLPVLLHNQKLHTAIATLQLMGNEQLDGWLNTECIEYSITYLLQNRTNLPLVQVEEFIYAFLSLLDKLSQDYWSRLHDEHLVKSLACCLIWREHFNDWLSHDLTNAALRHYGFSSTFWSTINNLQLDAELAELLNKARTLFMQLETVLGQPENWLTNYTKVFDGISYFHALSDT